MIDGLPPLNWLRAFEASALQLSFTRAAADLNLTATAVSYQVRALERFLHQPLFERLPRGLRMTEMGAAYLPDVRRAFEDISATTTKLFGHIGTGKITIRAPVSFLALWLSPRLKGFQELYPEIDILLLSALWADAQPDQAIDIDIRFGAGAWPGHASELLTHDHSAVICDRRLLVNGTPREKLDALFSGCLIHVVGHENHWAEVFRRVGAAHPPGVKTLRADTSIAAISLAAGAGGAAIVLKPYADWAIRAMALGRVFDFDIPVEQSHYLLIPLAEQRLRREVLLFRDWIIAEAGAGAPS